MDYNSQRKIVGKLRKAGKNPLLFLPCLIAAGAVVLVMSVCRFFDAALSDDNGNFLGIEGKGGQASVREIYEQREEKYEANRRNSSRQQKGAELPRRSAAGRLASGLLAMAFAFMVMPAADISAYTYTTAATNAIYMPNTLGSITISDVKNYCSENGITFSQLKEVDLTSGFSDSEYNLTLNDNIFVNMPLLTEVTLGSSTATAGNVALGRNFINIGGGDATVFVHGSDALYSDVRSELGSTGTQIIHDENGSIKAEFDAMGNANAVTATGGEEQILLQWDKVYNADGYAVYQVIDDSDGKITNMRLIGHYDNPNSGASSSGLFDLSDGLSCGLFVSKLPVSASGTSYRFAVRAYSYPSDGSSYKIFSRDFCISSGRASITNTPTDKITLNLEETEIGNGYVTICWNAYGNASGYTVHLTDSANETKTIYAGSELSCYIGGLNNDESYTVWVTSGSASSDTVTIIPTVPPESPENLSATPGDGTVKLTWDFSSDDDDDGIYYRLNVYDSENNTVRLGSAYDSIRSNSVTVSGLTNGETYTFELWTVKPLTGSSITEVTSRVAAAVSATPRTPLSVPSVTVAANDAKINVSWTTVANASGYQLLITDEDGNETLYDMGKATSYIDNNVSNNKLYSYQVRAYYVSSSEVIEYGDYSSARTGRIDVQIGAVQNLTAVGSDGQVALTWNAVSNADGYTVEIYSGSSLLYTYNCVTNSFTHTGLTNGITYTYKVTAYRMVDGQQEYGDAAPAYAIGTAGSYFPAPTDFTVVPSDGMVTLSWSAVDGADGYVVYVEGADGQLYELDRVTGTTAVHSNLPNGTSLTYCVRAFKIVSNSLVLGDSTLRLTAVVGTYLNSPTDVLAVGGDSVITISWKAVTGAEGYVVYCYDTTQSKFTPVGIITTTSFSHTGLTNGRSYTYMVAAYKTVSGEVKYSEYSLPVTASPISSSSSSSSSSTSTGTSSAITDASASDYRLYIVGTTPYGMSNSNLISAFAEKGAFDTDVDVRFTWSEDTAATVENVLNYYGDGIESFVVYPMDISLYVAGTATKTAVNAGYYITLTIPVPDELLPYSSEITVVHISDASQLEILPSTHVAVNGADCMQFMATDFSPYAFVVYLPMNGENMSSGAFASGNTAEMIETAAASPVLMCTSLPDLYRRRVRNKVYRVAGKSSRS